MYYLLKTALRIEAAYLVELKVKFDLYSDRWRLYCAAYLHRAKAKWETLLRK